MLRVHALAGQEEMGGRRRTQVELKYPGRSKPVSDRLPARPGPGRQQATTLYLSSILIFKNTPLRYLYSKALIRYHFVCVSKAVKVDFFSPGYIWHVYDMPFHVCRESGLGHDKWMSSARDNIGRFLYSREVRNSWLH